MYREEKALHLKVVRLVLFLPILSTINMTVEMKENTSKNLSKFCSFSINS